LDSFDQIFPGKEKSVSQVPFRIGVMQLTMEPLEQILAHARAMDRHGFDTIWLAEAYPWWRKHQMEARSSTAVSALIARETERLSVGWGIISPYTRHPIQVAMEARVTQEAAGNGRFRLGFGASKIFMKEIGVGDGRPARPRTAIREAMEIVRAVLEGRAVDFEGREFSAHVPALSDEAESPRWPVPLYVAGTGPKMQELAGEAGDGLLTPSITTPAFVRYSRGNVAVGARRAGRDPEEIDIGCTIVASIDEDPGKGREGAREIAGMYLANKVQNIQASADTLLECADLGQDEIRPIADAMERGGRHAAAAVVSDEILDKCKPIGGTPAQCIERIEEYRAAGCTHIMLELWGEDRDRQIELFGEKVLPHFR
jgi:5,10-methylenetetrahydromethanopterin reductase